jgi:hypothetical protein
MRLHNTDSLGDFAAHMASINQRIASLERASSSGGGGGGTGPQGPPGPPGPPGPEGPPGPGSTSTVEYLWGGDVTGIDPGAGYLRISGTGNQPRTFAISEIDADGQTRNFGLLKAGDTIVITDDPDAPPISGFARYLLTADPVDQGAWWSAVALRTDTSGVTAPPPIGTRLRVTAYLTESGSGDFVLRAGDTMTGPLVTPQLRTDSAGVVVPSGQGIGIADDTSWVKFRSGAGIGIWLRDPAGSIFHTAPGHIWQEQGGVQLMSLVWDRLTLQSNTIDVPYGFRIADLSSARADILRNAWELVAGAGDTTALTAAGNSGATILISPLGVTNANHVRVNNGVMRLKGNNQLVVESTRPQFQTWDNAPILSLGNDLGNAIAMHVPGLAPQMRVNQSRGEIIDFVNSASTQFISIGAQGFNTGSALRTKRNISTLSADRALRVARDVRPVTYLPAVRPQTLRPDPTKIETLRDEWHAEQVKHYAEQIDDDGNPVPMPKDIAEPDYSTDPRAFTGYDHDCAIDGCGETCVIAANDHERISFIAEELADVLPEAVYVDADGPSGYDVGQIAVVALAAVGELTRMVEALTARVAELEAR